MPAPPMEADAPARARNLLEQSLAPLLHTALALFASGVFYLVNSVNKANDTAAQLAAFKTEIVDRMSEYQTDVRGRFEEISRQVATLPDETANLHQLELRVNRLEAAKTDRDKQISDLTGTILQDHADLTTMISANRPKLGRGR